MAQDARRGKKKTVEAHKQNVGLHPTKNRHRGLEWESRGLGSSHWSGWRQRDKGAEREKGREREREEAARGRADWQIHAMALHSHPHPPLSPSSPSTLCQGVPLLSKTCRWQVTHNSNNLLGQRNVIRYHSNMNPINNSGSIVAEKLCFPLLFCIRGASWLIM